MPRKNIRCGVCGETTSELTVTECCDNWVCDGKCGCHWGHERYSMCFFHHNEGHDGTWKECEECRDGGEYEIRTDSEDENASSPKTHPSCRMCRERTSKLTVTECCNNWVCDGKCSCNWNHERYSMCFFHHNEGHDGTWKECDECRDGGEYEISTDEDENASSTNDHEITIEEEENSLPKAKKRTKPGEESSKIKKPRKATGESSTNSDDSSTDKESSKADEEPEEVDIAEISTAGK